MSSILVQTSRGTGHLKKYLPVGRQCPAPRANPAPNPFQVADTYTEKAVVETLISTFEVRGTYDLHLELET